MSGQEEKRGKTKIGSQGTMKPYGRRFFAYSRHVINREVFVYLVVGVLTTLVNIAVFTLLSQWFGHDRWWISNAPAVLAAILFAYVCNRTFVFRSKGPVFTELYRFISSRVVVSLLFEYGAMFLLYNVLNLTTLVALFYWEVSLSKLLTQFLVSAGNYLISKFFIFNRNEKPRQRKG